METNDQQQELLGALEALGGSAGNGKLRELLGWDEPTYDAVKAPLLSAGLLLAGRGRGGSVSLPGSAPLQAAPTNTNTNTSTRATPAPAPSPGPQPSGKQNLSAFIWGLGAIEQAGPAQAPAGEQPVAAA
ncbi:MAG: hypothetical protein ACKOPS_02735, partial [Cyanobium sp.]